jgi:hypothetical protein
LNNYEKHAQAFGTILGEDNKTFEQLNSSALLCLCLSAGDHVTLLLCLSGGIKDWKRR